MSSHLSPLAENHYAPERDDEDAILEELESNQFEEGNEIDFPPYLDNAKHPYAQYQKNFYAHNEYVGQVVKYAASCHQKILQLYQEIKYQYEAIVSAINNLKGHSDRIQKAVRRFHEDFDRHSNRFREHVDNFDANIETLAKIQLHDSMATENRKTLKDCVKEPQLRVWLQKCVQELDSFTSHIEEGEKFAQSIQRNVETHRLASPIVEFSELRHLRETAQLLLDKSRDVQKKLLDEYDSFHDTFREDSGQSHTSNSTIEAELKSLSEIRQITLNSAKQNLHELQNILRIFVEKKKALTRDFFERLRKIAQTQYDLRKLTNRYSTTFNTVLQSLRKKFSQIELIYYFPGAYQLACLEIARRRDFMRTYESEITKAKTTIDHLREREEQLEKKFNRYVGRYIPTHLVPALKESAPKCSIVMEHSQFSHLPEIPRVGGPPSNMGEVRKLLNADYTEKDLKVYEQSMDNNLFFEAMNMLNSTMMESRIDDAPKNHSRSASNEMHYKRRLEEQQQKIEQLQSENQHLKTEHDQSTKEAERAEKARQKHASENDQLRNQLRSLFERLQHFAIEKNDKEISEKVESWFEELS
eukprot:CAMPEP_0117444762 /NCGR_PEP_ID=MMETSP0759-20121206/5424_1 /TAXON_ID=63605 /ORGANISM="Percolomonas cosmopolitus, Strain WS" /LENGTH=585 /DNA_ID=CAMNT_0005236871 /DNA_START=1107 /DNA_END=2864 /DNA_ORIENTATION=-